MKKKLALVLSVIMIVLTLLAPAASYAEPEEGTGGETGGSEVTEPETPETPPAAPENPGSSSGGSSETKKPSSGSGSTSSGNKTTDRTENTQQTEDSTLPADEPEEEMESTIEKGTISIIFTHDMHSQMDAVKITENGKTREQGGFARMATIFSEISPNYRKDSFVLDGGDFSQGSIYQTIYTDYASELRMMGYLGYDVTTLGNHEFDFRSAGLSSMLENAVKKNKNDDFDLPQIAACNVDWDGTLADEQLAEDGENLQKAFEDYGVKESYTVIKKNGIKIAVFGLMGKEADEFAPESGTLFKDQVASAKETVSEIKANEKDVKLIVCLSHSGTSEDSSSSEDEILAQKVPDIDLIISGHSHTELPEPIISGNTVIASCGAYTENVGHVTFVKDKTTGEYRMDTYELIPEKESVKEDKDTLEELEYFKGIANRKFFGPFGYSADEVIARNSIQFTGIDKFGLEQGEDTLGNLLADSYIHAVKKAEGDKYEEVAVAVVPAGVIRASIPMGEVTVSDAFNILSLGMGADGSAVYPLVSAYLTGSELKALAEVDATVSEMMPVTRLYMSGLTYTVNDKRLFLNRAVDISLGNGSDLQKIDNDRLYRVVTDLYSCQSLSLVGDQSYGLLSIQPKDREGNVITDFEKHIVYDGKRELKTWYAVTEYLDSMGTVSSKYSKPEGRKTVVSEFGVKEFFRQPNKVGWLLRIAIFLPVLIVILIVLIIFFRRRRRDANMMFRVSEKQKKAIFAPPKKRKNLFAQNNRRESRFNRKKYSSYSRKRRRR